MKLVHTKKNYSLKDKEHISNQFIIGNGRIGYKGTMEEETKEDKVTFNVIGVYDQYEDKWRESLNLFNPLFFQVFENNQLVHYKDSVSHKVSLKLNEGVFKRKTVYNKFILETKRFVSSCIDNLISERVIITASQDVSLEILSGIDGDVYEINGPHYKSITSTIENDELAILGITNENLLVRTYLKEEANCPYRIVKNDKGIFKNYQINLKRNQRFELIKIGLVYFGDDPLLEEKERVMELTYYQLLNQHIKEFNRKFSLHSVKMKTDDDSEFLINYSIYELLILGNKNYDTSIPARGLSGQVYKGAIFWDTEIFMLPMFLYNDIEIAKSLIRYRIKTLPGALKKAKDFGYKGAFYAWESQEDGIERCSLYNITDRKSGKPLRTYFADKQIHISADIIYAINNYYRYTHDKEMLVLTIPIFENVALFYQSYSSKNNDRYHLLDVVGPDEYHERVNDNAFTNYHVYFSLKEYLNNLKSCNLRYSSDNLIYDLEEFIDSIYLPKINEDGVIEQFSGYFNLEDVNVDEFKKRIKNKNDYLGGENGLATKTRIIKQADVVTLLALYPNNFTYEVKKANFDFYYPYTEHGSSLSNSMYGLLASDIGELDLAYKYFRASAGIDLSKENKLYAGGTFIGGTHPASNGGSYLCLMNGFLKMKYENGNISLSNNLPKQIKEVEINYTVNGKVESKVFKND